MSRIDRIGGFDAGLRKVIEGARRPGRAEPDILFGVPGFYWFGRRTSSIQGQPQ